MWWRVGVMSHSCVGRAFVPSPLPKRGLGHTGPAPGSRGCFRIEVLPPRALGLLALPCLNATKGAPGAGMVPSRAKASLALAPVPSRTQAHGGSWEQQLHPCVAPKVEEGMM